MDKRQFKKEMKAHEKRLEERAKQGALTFNEKEQYQSMLRNRERNKALRQARMQKAVGTVVLVIGLIIAREIIYYAEMNNQNPEAMAMAYPDEVVGGIQEDDGLSMEEKSLELARLRQLWSDKTDLLNTVAKEYKSTSSFDAICYEKLENLKAFSDYDSFEELLNIQNAYDAQIKMYFREIEENKLNQETLDTINHQMSLITVSYNQEALRLTK